MIHYKHRRICQGGWGGGSPPSFKKIRAKCPKFGQNAQNSGKMPKIWAKYLMGFFLEKKQFFSKFGQKIFDGVFF